MLLMASRFPSTEGAKDPFKDIEDGLQRGDETLLNEELDKNSKLAHKSGINDGESLLHIVARYGSVEAANRLIQLGANINAKDSEGRTPLYRAIEWKAEMVQFLCNNGADITVTSNNCISILQEALINGSLGTVYLLVSNLYGTYPKSTHNEKSETVIKCREIAKILLVQEIDFNYPNTKYSLVLHFVLMHGDEETFKFVLHECKNFDVHALGPERQTILHYAVYENKKACIQHLVDYGIDINIGDFCNRTALHYAVRKKDPELVGYFLKLGAEVNKKTIHSGYTPLHVAVALGNSEIIEMLLNSGADINAKCESGRMMGPRCIRNHRASVLNFVCGRSVLKSQLSMPGINYSDLFKVSFTNKRNRVKMVFKKEMIKFLLEKGAQTEVFDFSCDENSATPLHRACETGRLDIVELLLDYGADIYAHDSWDRNMLHYAVLGNNFQIVDLLLRRGFDINARDKYLRTPLYNFVKENEVLINGGYKNLCRISMVDFLVDNGADVNIHCGTQHNTPLHCAGCLENPHLIESLLELNADFKKAKNKDKYGHEPFTIASFSKSWDSSELNIITESGKVFLAFRALTEDNFYNIEDCNIADLKTWKLANEFFETCKSEVQRLKHINICDENYVTFYIFLTSLLIKASKFARNEKIMQVLESREYEKEFPCYAFLLQKRIVRVVNILYIENNFTDFIQEYAKIKLPIDIIDKILSYLSVGDMRNFGRALSLLESENYGVICR